MCHCIIPDVNVVTGFYAFIDRGISAPGHGREVVDFINAIYKSFFFQFISTVKLPGEKVMTHRWLCTLEPIHPILVRPVNFKNTCLLRHANMG